MYLIYPAVNELLELLFDRKQKCTVKHKNILRSPVIDGGDRSYLVNTNSMSSNSDLSLK